MTAPNGDAARMALAPPDPDQVLRYTAIIQSLELMCTEARTRELHKDAAIAVLRDQLQKSQQEVAALKKKMEPAPAPTKKAAEKGATKS